MGGAVFNVLYLKRIVVVVMQRFHVMCDGQGKQMEVEAEGKLAMVSCPDILVYNGSKRGRTFLPRRLSG